MKTSSHNASHGNAFSRPSLRPGPVHGAPHRCVVSLRHRFCWCISWTGLSSSTWEICFDSRSDFVAIAYSLMSSEEGKQISRRRLTDIFTQFRSRISLDRSLLFSPTGGKRVFLKFETFLVTNAGYLGQLWIDPAVPGSS